MPASDDFNRADAATLGANWTEDPLLEHSAGSGMSIISNQAAPDANSAPNGAYWSAESYSGDMEAVIEVGAKPGDKSYFFLLARIKNPVTTGVTGYYLFVQARSGETDMWQIYRVDSNTTTVLLNATPSPRSEFSPGHLIRFRCQGDQIIGSQDTGTGYTEIIRVTDVTYPGTGTAYIGMGVDGGPGVTTARIESFSGGLVTAATATPAMAAATGVGR